MVHSGLPWRRLQRSDRNKGRESALYYAERRKLHLENGITLLEYSENTKLSVASVEAKWNWFCSVACLEPEKLLQTLVAADVKSWFDWIDENFRDSV